MRRKTVITSLVVLLLALLPTYFIIYNSLHTTGLPDFSSQLHAEIIEPNKHMYTLTSSRDEYYLMAGVLSNLSESPTTDATVDKDAEYTITFVSRSGNKTRCSIYAATDRLSAYVETAQGKLYELYRPAVTYGGETLSPSIVRYAREKSDGTTVLSAGYTRVSENGIDLFSYEISSFEELRNIVFADEEMRFSAKLRDARDAEIASFSSQASLLAYTNTNAVRKVNITVEWVLKKDVVLRATYIFHIGE